MKKNASFDKIIILSIINIYTNNIGTKNYESLFDDKTNKVESKEIDQEINWEKQLDKIEIRAFSNPETYDKKIKKQLEKNFLHLLHIKNLFKEQNETMIYNIHNKKLNI